MQPKSAAYMPQLDALRALAVLAVIASHTMSGDLKQWIRPGQAGVRMFFVLSGFLITGILLRYRRQVKASGGSQTQLFIAFYARRFLRIFPIYYLYIALLAVCGFHSMLSSWPWHALYLSNVYVATLGSWPDGTIAHLWSLSVEEQFYIVWPFFMLLLPERKILPCILAGLAIGPATRLITFYVTSNIVASEVLMPSCVDSLAAGSLLAFGKEYRWTPFLKIVSSRFIVFVACLTSMLFALAFWYQTAFILRITFVDSVQALAFSILIFRASIGFHGAIGKFLNLKPLHTLGQISYGIYLYHPLVIFALPNNQSLDNSAVRFLLTTVASATIAMLSWTTIEQPILLYKRKFNYTSN